MKTLITFLAFALFSVFTLQGHAEISKEDSDQIALPGRCGCCEEPDIADQIKDESKRQAEFRQMLIEKLNVAYKTTRLEDRGPEIKLIELHLLNHRDYTRCMVCSQIYGPGVYHMYRHPYAYGSEAEMWQFHEKIERERAAAREQAN